MSADDRLTLRLLIDGREVEAAQGETVLEIAQRIGVDIPALCHEAGMQGWGACRLCLIEIEGVDKLQAACTTVATQGMVVRTDSARARAKRESYLRMYLSDHNAYCEAPCVYACPTHVDIPGYLAALAAGDWEQAGELVRRELPFPGILGRVCPGYCEPVCRRADVDEPVAICALHRAVGDHGQPALVADSPTGRRVAVVGAGPAGLAAAWLLTARGHRVTVYDARERPGGALRYGVPEFRLPESVVDEELQPLWDAGARFIGGPELGWDLDSGTLFDAGFDAQITSVGSGPTHTWTGPGGGAALSGLDVLQLTREGEQVSFGRTVVVVGDGVSAVDVARTALRLGAETVTVVAPGERIHGPIADREVQAAAEEGVAFLFRTRVESVIADGGEVQGVRCVLADLTDFILEASTVVLCPLRGLFGAEAGHDRPHADVPETGPGSATELARGAEFAGEADPLTGRTAEVGVFEIGETSPWSESAIHAVARGKRVALAVDAWLRGEDLQELEGELAAYAQLPYLGQLAAADGLSPTAARLAERDPVWLKMGVSADEAPREATRVVPVAERVAALDVEVDGGLNLESVQAEAARCLQCVCPSLGRCDLQRLGVEYGITENKLVKRGARVRSVAPQLEHPFIRRDMSRCIACGRCARVCRDVAGPACYDFTGRSFDLKVTTPYDEALQAAGCISCGRCVTSCPTGALVFNERKLTSFRVDESRCVLCGDCVGVCPVDALERTGQFEEARRRWHELIAHGSGLAGGHRMCAGCGAPIVVRQVLMGASDPVVVSSATGCLEVSTTIYPYTSWESSFIHTAFENSAATLSGVETAFRALKKKGLVEGDVKFIAFGGDGGTYDIGLQSLSGAMERGHRMLYVCYDNGAYMNTGFQRSGATPQASWTTTSPVGVEGVGKLQHRKNLTDLMIAHDLEYVAQASPHDPRDLVRKVARALAVDGPTFLNILAPCPRGWRSEAAESIDLARQAVNTCYWPLFEVEGGTYRLNYRPRHKLPLVSWLERQGRFAHLFKPGGEEALSNLVAWVDAEWEKLLRRCGEPSEAEWQERLQENGCLLR